MSISAALLDQRDRPQTDARQGLGQLAGIEIRASTQPDQRAREGLRRRHRLQGRLNRRHDEARLGRPARQLIEHLEPLRAGVAIRLRLVEKEGLPRREGKHRSGGQRPSFQGAPGLGVAKMLLADGQSGFQSNGCWAYQGPQPWITPSMRI